MQRVRVVVKTDLYSKEDTGSITRARYKTLAMDCRRRSGQ